MASIYQGDGSPIWWIKFHALAGKIRSESTRCRTDIGSETANVRQLKAKRAQRGGRCGSCFQQKILWSMGRYVSGDAQPGPKL